jgi:hypothetical protein
VAEAFMSRDVLLVVIEALEVIVFSTVAVGACMLVCAFR